MKTIIIQLPAAMQKYGISSVKLLPKKFIDYRKFKERYKISEDLRVDLPDGIFTAEGCKNDKEKGLFCKKLLFIVNFSKITYFEWE